MPDSSLNQFDKKLIEATSFKVSLGPDKVKSITFQFPLKITSDTNNSEWLAKDLWSIEPLKIHKGSGGRKLTAEWEYIATDKIFNGVSIAQICRDLKSYFFEFPQAWKYYPIIFFKHGEIVPTEATFRLMQSSIVYGPEYTDNSGIYPIYTKVSVGLELVTNNANPNAGGQALVKVEPLRRIQPDWY